MTRDELATRYLGPDKVALEIGAYHTPWPSKAMTLHAAKHTRERLVHMAENDPNLKGFDLTKIPRTDFVCDATTLNAIPEGHTFDVIVSSHVLEHLPNPIQAIQEWLRRLNPNGVILMAVPNKDHTFDKPRPVSTWDEVWLAWSSEIVCQDRMMHCFIEWFHLIDKRVLPVEAAERAIANGDDIHFNVWDHSAMVEFLDRTNALLGRPYFFELLQPQGHEFFIALRKL